MSAPVALVTGAARGIGAATCRTLLAEGYTVVACDRCAPDPRLPYAMASPEDLEGLREAANGGGRIDLEVVDVTDAEAFGAVVARAEERHGGLDAIVAGAGVVAGGVPQWQVPIEQEQAVVDVNLGGVLTAARVGIPALLRRPRPRRGRFVAISSTAATRGLPMIAAYCAAKAGVVGLVHALATELRESGVTANAVCPGSTDTAILAESARLYGLHSAEDFAGQQPLGRLQRPGEVAAAVSWLVGTESGTVTGAAIPVDGGLAL